MTEPLNPVVYTCVVSEYNLPEFEACVARRPTDVVLVVSDDARFKQAAKRLANQLREALPGARIHRPDQQAHSLRLGGDDVIECQDWAQRVLKPYLLQDDLRDKHRYLNFTGGTKAMILALVSVGDWEILDYKANGRQELQAVSLKADATGTLTLERSDLIKIEDVMPAAVARLHNDHIEPVRLNRLFDNAASLPLAEAIWKAQLQKDPTLAGLFDLLESVWSSGRDYANYRCERVEVPLPTTLDRSELKSWLDRFCKLQDGALSLKDDHLELPGNRPGVRQRDFVAWVNANWLEQLCGHWLIAAGLPASAIARNLKVGPDATHSGTHREADLVLHNRGQTRLIEVKAGLAKGHAPAELENQVSSLTERFGKTRKALFVSPRLKQKVGSNRWENFELRCQANQVALCCDRSSLLKFAGLS
ncbi:hypothetical protein AAG895_17865 [Thauera sp. JM12B12]|uniref:hypothetical protein n=1 Tax=Thauera sp. JM12B12 TaxID=3142262 RepID=UPI0031F3CDE3